ncbi:MAG TPA: RHS repeat-associated core domain-containing protein, partial [Thermoanaerobaculia bacterium]|nr:RHS repeat-associated core domain-containing protein [Thermoanaerobaculia bacterium]
KAGYDCLGRMTSQERDGRTWAYRYNPDNQLLAATSSQGEGYSYAYDYLGRRIEKKSADGTATYYLYDDYELVVLPDGKEQHTQYVEGLAGHVASITRSGEEVAAALAARQAAEGWRVPVQAVLVFLLGLFLLALPAATRWRAGRRTATAYARRNPWKAALVPAVVFALLLPLGAPAAAAQAPEGTAGIPGPGVLFFHQDHLNSTSLLTDDQGAVSAQVDYLPYGEVFQLTGKDNFRAKFSAKELDEASGLYYFNARYYDPRTGRFTSADTQLVGGPDQSAAALNLYAYTGNNPVSYTDPSGHDFGVSAIIAAIVVVALGVTAGVYAGGAAVNHNLNPAQWDWQSPKTIVGMMVGGAIGGVGAAVDVAAVAAMGPVAGGIVGGAIAGVFEGAAFSALGGGSPGQIAEDALLGGALGVAFTAIGASVGRAAARTRAPASSASRGAEQVAKVETRLAKRLNVAADVCRCFGEDTEVATADGDVAIADIQPGDPVWAFDEATGRVELRPVTGVFERVAGEILLVTVNGEVLEATPGHPVWVEGRGWTDAAELVPGDRLVDREGEPLTVERVERRQGRFRVFNLEVEGSHTFYASSRRALVHNCDGIKKLVAVVLGESMNTRVIPVAQKMGWKTFKPRGKDPTKWKQNQKKWIYRQIKSGRPIYDIGIDPLKLQRSEYYEIEQKWLMKSGKKKVFLQDVDVDIQGVKKTFPVDEWKN